MENDEVIEFLEERVEQIRKDEPYATNAIAAYESVINDILEEE